MYYSWVDVVKFFIGFLFVGSIVIFVILWYVDFIMGGVMWIEFIVFFIFLSIVLIF